MEKNKIKVSIICWTCDCVKFVQRSINSLLSQKTNFAYEILICDTGSEDGTKEILLQFRERYPEIIQVFFENELNLKIYDFFSILKRLHIKGKYIALSKGCDEWIYDKKLQEQYDQMEKNLNITLCVHNVIDYNYRKNITKKRVQDIENGIVKGEEIIEQKISLSSAFFRAKRIKEVPEFVYNIEVQEIAFRLYCVHSKGIYYFNEIWGIDIIENEEYMENKLKNIDFIKGYMEFIVFLNRYTKRKYERYFYKTIREMCLQAIHLSDENIFRKEGLTRCINKWKRETKHVVDDMWEEIYQNNLFYCIDYLDFRLKRFIQKCNNENGELYLYGIGGFAKREAEKLKNMNVWFEGFVVSDGYKEKSVFMGHKVIELSDLDRKKSYIYLSLNLINTRQVLYNVEKLKFENILYYTK